MTALHLAASYTTVPAENNSFISLKDMLWYIEKRTWKSQVRMCVRLNRVATYNNSDTCITDDVMITGCESVEGLGRISPFQMTWSWPRGWNKNMTEMLELDSIAPSAFMKMLKTTELTVREHFYSDWGINATIKAHLRTTIIRLSWNSRGYQSQKHCLYYGTRQ